MKFDTHENKYLQKCVPQSIDICKIFSEIDIKISCNTFSLILSLSLISSKKIKKTLGRRTLITFCKIL